MVEMKSLINQAIVRQCSAFHVPSVQLTSSFSILSQEEGGIIELARTQFNIFGLN